MIPTREQLADAIKLLVRISDDDSGTVPELQWTTLQWLFLDYFGVIATHATDITSRLIDAEFLVHRQGFLSIQKEQFYMQLIEASDVRVGYDVNGQWSAMYLDNAVSLVNYTNITGIEDVLRALKVPYKTIEVSGQDQPPSTL